MQDFKLFLVQELCDVCLDATVSAKHQLVQCLVMGEGGVAGWIQAGFWWEGRALAFWTRLAQGLGHLAVRSVQIHYDAGQPAAGRCSSRQLHDLCACVV